jgi:hypothetical protein
MLQFFISKYMLFWRVRNIAFWRALSKEQYKSVLMVELPYWPLKSYAVSSRVVLQWLCLTEFDWCASLVSTEMRRPTHLQERNPVMLFWGQSLVFRWHLRVSSGGSRSGSLNHTAPNDAWRMLAVSQECG